MQKTIRNTLYILLFILSSMSLFSESLQIPIITYHTHAPFITGESTGLTYDLAKYLSDKSDGHYKYEVTPMSRPMLNQMLDSKSIAIIPWVTPGWFKDDNQSKYLWANGILLNDGIAYISNRNNKVDLERIVMSFDLTFGGIKGHYYTRIDPIVQEGQITRYDSDNHIDNFRKILVGRIDFSITPLSSAYYLVNDYNMDDDFYIFSDESDNYARRIIISHNDSAVKRFLDDVIETMDEDPIWQELLAKYKILN